MGDAGIILFITEILDLKMRKMEEEKRHGINITAKKLLMQ